MNRIREIMMGEKDPHQNPKNNSELEKKPKKSDVGKAAIKNAKAGKKYFEYLLFFGRPTKQLT